MSLVEDRIREQDLTPEPAGAADLSWAIRDGWWLDARCGGRTPARFFTDDGDNRAAKALCAGCPVRVDCLVYGLDEPAGIWGGLSLAERERLVRLRGRLGQDPEHRDNARDVARLTEAGADPLQLATVCGLEPAAISGLLNWALVVGGDEDRERGASRRPGLAKRLALGDPTVPHGRASTYNAGCRCQRCRGVMAARARERNAEGLRSRVDEERG